jgi:hypothetical protein
MNAARQLGASDQEAAGFTGRLPLSGAARQKSATQPDRT